MNTISNIRPFLKQCFILILVFTFNTSNAQLKIKSNGYVGIGITNPEAIFHVHGDKVKFSFPTSGGYTPTPLIIDRYYDVTRFYPNGDNKGYLGQNFLYWQYSYITDGYFDNVRYINLIHLSDRKLKKNIKPLDKSLNNVLKLKPCKYDYDFSSSNSPHLQNIKPDEYSNQFGFIAQELMEIYPNLVKEDTTTNLLSIDYEGLIPVLTMAIQELDQKILDLEQKLSNVSTNKSSDIDNTSKSDVTLGKNKPNPFRENTMIEYYIPVEVSNASFIIYDMQGKQLKSMKITERGNGFVTIQGNELRPGIYNYSLIVDGEVVGVERMILTD